MGQFAQEDCGVPYCTEDSRFWSSDTRDGCVETPSTKLQTVQKSSKMLTEFKLVLQETTRSVLMLPLSS